MAGCGGNCACGRIPREENGPRDRYTIADAIAKVIVDNRVIQFAVDYIEKHPNAKATEIETAYHLLSSEDGERA